MTVRVTFHGAAETVTGSKHLVEFGKEKILLDCGLFQGKKELRLRNWDAPRFSVDDLTAVVISHAHVDHIGYLPRLVKCGYRGPIYLTEATAELAQLLLLDSANLQEEEARFAAKEGYSKHHPPKPLYSVNDAKQVFKYFKTIPRHEATEIRPGVNLTYRCAGHILGSASVTLDVGKKRVTFSGDIGRYNAPILPDPCPVELGDLLLCEGTYGNRDHENGDHAKELRRVIDGVVERRGPLIIPAFAIGRTQTLMYIIAEMERAGTIPVLPVYIDSPMAIDATNIYEKYEDDFDDEAAAIAHRRKRALVTTKTIFCKTTTESKALNSMKGPRIIIAGSGMVNGGRVLHHLLHHLPDESTTVLFVGYQGEGTRGATIQSGSPTVRMFGRDVPINAHVETISGLSAHADRNELIRWLKSSTGTPSEVKIVHCEHDAGKAFSDKVYKELGWKASIALDGESIEL